MIRVRGIPIFLEPHMPNWEYWRVPWEQSIIAGIHAYQWMVYQLQVKPSQLVTDPGPLDASVS